jgi:hypothetical protein
MAWGTSLNAGIATICITEGNVCERIVIRNSDYEERKCHQTVHRCFARTNQGKELDPRGIIWWEDHPIL